MASIAGKVYALTGAKSGLGLHVASTLARLNAGAISISDLNGDHFHSVRSTLSSINPKVQLLTSKVDVTRSVEVNSWIEETVDKFGDLDGAVNCAGTINNLSTETKPHFLNETDDSWTRVINTNLTGTLYSMRAEVKAMVALPKKPRSIVNISSAASLFHDPTIMSYCITKAGIAGLTTTIAKDLAGTDIRLNAVSPSATKTGMAVEWYKNEEEAMADMARRGITLLEPDRVANAIVWLLSDESGDVSGVNIPIGASVP
ncbi:hypothetical protein PV10_08445 [Exophiala mesophila]|uniref:Uncharacterized protein n=1 Tax=Exophiala mesophila TaxID=212818 RepID=A0A0D1Z205_EXOME|nr:uncharacterized protein PV10_08445 [Exophiala mesophila]KIV88802.1 hypothetical protein PV10_08445 [Exophiala mesophila]